MQPKILTEDLFKLYLTDKTVKEWLRQVSDLDIDLTQPGVEERLILQRKKLQLLISTVEQEVLQKYSEPRVRVSPARFDPFFPAIGAVHLIGYREVFEEEVNTGTDLPSLPDGTDYEVGDPNVITSDERLVEALRQTISKIAHHEVQLPNDGLTRKLEGESREFYDPTRRPSSLYRLMQVFDIRRSHHYL